MRKLYALAVAGCLAACLVASLFALPSFSTSRAKSIFFGSLDSSVIYDYEAALATSDGGDDSNAIRLSYDPMTDKLAVGVFEKGDATVYVAYNVTDPIGTHTLQQYDAFDDGFGSFYAPVSSITVQIDAINTDEVTFTVTYSATTQGKHVAPNVDAMDLQRRYGVCSNPNGTGACDQVHTNRDWWRCFVCCFYGGGCGA